MEEWEWENWKKIEGAIGVELLGGNGEGMEWVGAEPVGWKVGIGGWMEEGINKNKPTKANTHKTVGEERGGRPNEKRTLKAPKGTKRERGERRWRRTAPPKGRKGRTPRGEANTFWGANDGMK
jgi:hypothetical protein